MSKLASRITDAEAEVMRILWEAGCELPKTPYVGDDSKVYALKGFI